VHSIRFANYSDLSWPILAMLNVKYAITVDDAFFYNIKSETDHSTFDSSALRVLTNPFHVTPRYFFAKHVAPMSMPDNDQAAPSDCPDDAAPGNVADDGKPYPSSVMVSTRGVRLPVDPRLCSIAAGFGEGKEFSTEGDVAVEFLEDQVIARMSPSPQERFLVLNERDNPFWKAYAGGRELKVWETNLAMRGVVVPKDTAEVSFFFRPFAASYSSLGIVAVGLTSFLCCLLIFAGVIGGKNKRAEQWDKLGRSDRVR
jgi:hypothetical protein